MSAPTMYIRAALAVAALYLATKLSFKYLILYLLAAALVQMYTRRVEISLAAFVLIAFLVPNRIDQALDAAPRASAGRAPESFQEKNAETITARLEANRVGVPKVQVVTGVLESPSILDNVPLNPAQELTSDAQPGASIPASAKARVLIYPPAEGFVPAPKESRERPPMENPYLQNGEDVEGVGAALIVKGTDIPSPDVIASEGRGVLRGAAAAF